MGLFGRKRRDEKLDDLSDKKVISELTKEGGKIDVFVRGEEWDNVIKCGQEIIDLDPTNAYAWTAYAWNIMGMGYTQLENSEKSIECTLEAVRIEPDNFFYLNDLACNYFLNEQYESALDAYEKSIQHNPENVGNLNYTAGVDIARINGVLEEMDERSNLEKEMQESDDSLSNKSKETPISILKLRLAKGEITKEEFEGIKNMLE